MPWLDAELRRAIGASAHHAWLIRGPSGVGQFEFALAFAEASLCEDEATPPVERPCGQCVACRLLAAGSHPDLLVVVPQAMREQIGRATAEDGGDDAPSTAAAKKKPSREIRVDEVRTANAFAATTSSRGRAKVVVMHPAERLNPIAGNAFLKTLEEPPGGARFLLTTSDVEALLPTLRSRCQSFVLSLPGEADAAAWLSGQGVADAAVLLAAAGGQPGNALALARDGIDAAAWRAFPKRVAAGQTKGVFDGWPLPRLVDALHKLCVDAARTAGGAAPRWFAAADLPAGADLVALVAWSRELTSLARSAEHPWYLPLAVDALVERGREALQTPRSRGRPRATEPLNSRDG